MRKVLVLIAVVLVSFTAAQADTLSLVTSRVGSDSLNWVQLGAPFTAIPNPFTAVSVGGIVVTGTFAGTTGEIRQQGDGWNGNFTPGDNLVWTDSQGPLTLAFSQGLNEVGTQIQQDNYGAFTAEIDAYNGVTLLGSFTENGNSNANGDGSAIDIGVMDLSGSNITSVTLSLTSSTNFAINQLDLNSATTPEPGTIMLLGSGLGLVGFARRRLSARFK
jgi:hypothetical protein